MTKLEQTAIALLRKSDRRGEVYPAVWNCVNCMTSGRFKSLSQLLEADLCPDDERLRDLIVERVVAALESGNLDLLAEEGPPAPDPAQPTAGTKP